MIKSIHEITEDEIDDVNLGQLISNVNRYFSKSVDKSLKEHNLTRSQAQFLLKLYQHDHISQETLCKNFDMTEGTVARTMKRIEDKGFITREINPNDKRKKVIILTDSGKEIIHELSKQDIQVLKELNDKFTPEEMHEFKVSLKKIIDILKEK